MKRVQITVLLAGMQGFLLGACGQQTVGKVWENTVGQSIAEGEERLPAARNVIPGMVDVWPKDISADVPKLILLRYNYSNHHHFD